jgi:hypothetical protein
MWQISVNAVKMINRQLVDAVKSKKKYIYRWCNFSYFYCVHRFLPIFTATCALHSNSRLGWKWLRASNTSSHYVATTELKTAVKKYYTCESHPPFVDWIVERARQSNSWFSFTMVKKYFRTVLSEPQFFSCSGPIQGLVRGFFCWFGPKIGSNR